MKPVNVFNQSIGFFLQGQQQGFHTPEQLDDELELKTGCRFGQPKNCISPDCKHNEKYYGLDAYQIAEKLDDELELQTGCRYGNSDTCRNPDCKHNGYAETK